MKKLISIIIIFILLIQSGFVFNIYANGNYKFNILSNTNSYRNSFEDIIVIPDTNPLFGLIGSYVACWYNSLKNYGLKPMIIHNNGVFSQIQKKFFNQFFSNKTGSILSLGEKVDLEYETTNILGNISHISIKTARHIYNSTTSAIIISNKTSDYQLHITAGPLASYLDIPILVFDNNTLEIKNVCFDLNISQLIIIGDIQINIQDIYKIMLETDDEIQDLILSVINDKFGKIDYITLTNPSDVIPPYIISKDKAIISDHINNFKLTLLGKKIDVSGSDSKTYKINVSQGINRIQIYTNTINNKLGFIKPIIYLNLYDSSNNLVAYSSSFAYDIGSAYLETLICNASDDYFLEVKIYNGILGGYFSQRGFSYVNNDINLSIIISNLKKPHLPYISDLSIMSSYLTAAHGGIIIANQEFELTDETYQIIADGYPSGPWYNENLHNFTNEKVNFIVDTINSTLNKINGFNMLDSYLNGPAWLAILAGTNMIPMYYYSPSQTGLLEKGLPSDNPYSLDNNLSISRVIGWNVQDVSVMIARTLFYFEICKDPTNESGWHNNFNFIFGEGFGETGGIFHQIPYSKEIENYGFDTKVFGDFRNGRLYAELLNVYTGSNYIEYLGHGDWFWFPPSLYGFDIYSKAIDVSHAKDWIYEKPSIFLSSACLMGRIDGILPRNNIGVTMLHAGCNGFVGATRETGQEAGLTIFENHLIVDNFSIGEALRGEKKIDKEPPTYFVRVLFGDPAFNPYEPNNGFSNQGRPLLLH